jgi:alkylation response protein AidB-like acyl-CoA dehydrogenase
MSAEGTRAIGTEELEHYRELARQYTKRSVVPLFAGEHVDGNLTLLPAALGAAVEAGIAASPDQSEAGSQYGIWGQPSGELGIAPSLALLSTIAETCGGVAMCLHAQGLAASLVLEPPRGGLSERPARVALCLQEGLFPPSLETILAPAHEAPGRLETAARRSGDSYILSGLKSFVYAMDKPDAYVVLGRADDKWGCFLVPASAPGVVATDVGLRTGLRACRLEHVELRDVIVPASARLDAGDARDLVVRALSLHWAGMAAIAAGIAKAACAAARRYAAERYQGGARIESHAAVQSLIAGAEAAAAGAETATWSLVGRDLGSLRGLGEAARAKLMVMELCARAVTDALQTFGGYGYMEDYGMEKRLRDVAVLKAAAGSPLYLKRLIFAIGKETVS